MTKAIKELLVRCHPDRNGGDHSKMELVYSKMRRPSGNMKNLRRCRICGVATRGLFTCRMHRYTKRALAALWLLTLPALGADKVLLGWTPGEAATTNFILYQSTNEIVWNRAGFILSTNVALATNNVYPTYYRVTATTWDGYESDKSEQLGFMERNMRTTVYGQYSPVASGPWKDYTNWIFRGTNVGEAHKFFRMRITNEPVFRTATKP